MLALNIQTLFYKIGASNLEFKQRVDESKGKLHEFEKKTQDNIRILRNWSAAAGAAATGLVYALNRTVQSTNTTAETVAKLSEQTGVAVENMQGLGYAARQNKSSMEELGQSMVRLTRRTQEAAQGNQSYVASYERIGVSFRNVDGSIKSTETLLLDLADAFAASTDENLKTQVAFNLLGDSGYNLIPLLNQGRGEIIRLAEEANRLGTVLSRENIEKFARYDNVMVKFREGMAGVKTQLATAVVPVFTLLGKKANEGLERFMDWVRENPKLVAQGVVLGGVLTTLGLALGAVALGMTIVGKGAVLVKGLFGLLTNPIVWLVALALLLYTAWDENWGGIQGITERVIAAIQSRLEQLQKWWETSETAKKIQNLWADLSVVWSDSEATFRQKTRDTIAIFINFAFGDGAAASIKAFWDDLTSIWGSEELTFNEKVRATLELLKDLVAEPWNWVVTKSTEAWDWLEENAPWLTDTLTTIKNLIDGGWSWVVDMVIKPLTEGVYDAIKTGLETGDWSDFWGIASEKWSQGVLLGVTLWGGALGAAKILSLIKSGLGLAAAAVGATGVPGVIGALSVIIKLKESEVSGEGYEAFGKNFVAALLAGILIGGLTGSIRGGALAFTVVFNLELGTDSWDGIVSFAEWLGHILSRPLSEFVSYGDFIRQRAQDEFASGLYEENLQAAEKWVRQFDPNEWDYRVEMTARHWDVTEDDLRALLGMESLAEVGLRSAAEELALELGTTVDDLKALDVRSLAQTLMIDNIDLTRDIAERHGANSNSLFRYIFDPELAAAFKPLGSTVEESQLTPGEETKPIQVPIILPDMTEENIREVIELLTAITGAEVDPELVMLLARLESGAKWGKGTTHIVHPESGAMGPLQSMPISRSDVDNRGGLGGEENLHSWVPGMSLEDNWVAQTEYGIRYIQLLLDKESGKIERVAEELGISFAESLFLSYQEGINALNNAALSGNLTGDLSMVATGHRRTIEEQLTTYHNFTEGGEAIIDAWADGMLNKKPRVEASAEELAQTVADFLIGQSPPPKGPLKYIDIGMQKTMEAGMEGARKGLMDGIPTLELTAREVGESAKEGLFEGLAAGKQVALTPYGVELADEISDEDSPLYMRVLANVKKLLSALGDSTMGWLKGQFPELMAEFDGLFEKAELDFERLTELIEGIGGETDKVKETTKQWTDSLVSGLSNAIGYGRGLETFDGVLNVFDNFLGMLASQFLQTKVFAPLFDKIGFGDFLAGLPIFHDGGLVLSPAAYYHSGGYIGELRSDEVPIIAQTGERVLSRQQNDQFESLLQNVSTDGAGAQHIEVNINAVDAASFQELLMRNSDGVKHLIIDDVGRNGPLRKILLQLARS